MQSLCALNDGDACLHGAGLADELVRAGLLPEAKEPSARVAIVLLERACDLGLAIGCTAGGLALLEGAPKDARKLFAKGCDANEPTSCLQLAGLLGKKDRARAKILRRKACDAGLKDAC